MSEKGVRVKRRKLDDYRLDPANPNRGSERGKQILRRSLSERGAGRSALAAGDDVLLAGNQTVQAARAVGITDVIEIETDGKALVVVKRTDLASDDPEARQLAYEHNRAEDVREWDAEQVFADLSAGVDLEALFRADELDALRGDMEVEQQVNAAVDAAEGGSSSRLSEPKDRQVKPVLLVDDVARFERAIRATGLEHRGKALLAICDFYLEHKEG